MVTRRSTRRTRIIASILLVTGLACSAHWKPLTHEGLAPRDVDAAYLEGSQARFELNDGSVWEVNTISVADSMVTALTLSTQDTVRIDLNDCRSISVATNEATTEHTAFVIVIFVIAVSILTLGW